MTLMEFIFFWGLTDRKQVYVVISPMYVLYISAIYVVIKAVKYVKTV